MDLHVKDGAMTPRVLQTRRLTLRPVTLDDAGAIVTGLRDWDVVQWLSAPPFPYAHDDAVHFVTKIIPQTTTWAIDAGEGLIGVIGVKPDLGYWLAATYHGQHIMTEATAVVTAWYFDQSDDDLVSGHFPDNAASRTVLQKLGFVDTEVVDQLQTATQEQVKLQRMVLSKADWLARHA